MAYFDNAATTFPKPESVYRFMDDFYRQSGANVGRGQYKIAQSAGSLINETRSLILDLFHCPAKQTVFTPTATIALNIIIQGLIKNGVKNVYISPFEHNAVTRTLHSFESTGLINVIELFVSADYKYDLERIRYQFEDLAPDLVVISHASNVIGLIAPIEDIFYLAKRYNAYTVADMSQTAGLIDCNVGLDTFDFAVFAGHKTMYGPTGISGFVMKPDIKLLPILFGGTGVDSANQDMPEGLPERFEMGTLNLLGIAGLNAAIKWINTVGIDVLKNKEVENRTKLISIISNYKFLRIIGDNKDNEYVGIVSCVIDGISSDSAEILFSDRDIAVRTGLQCAPFAHLFLHTYPAGTIRFSTSWFTTDEDFNSLTYVLDELSNEL